MLSKHSQLRTALKATGYHTVSTNKVLKSNNQNKTKKTIHIQTLTLPSDGMDEFQFSKANMPDLTMNSSTLSDDECILYAYCNDIFPIHYC